MIRLSGQDVGFDPAVSDDDDDNSCYAPAAYLTDASNDPALSVEQEDWSHRNADNLTDALEQLDDRSRVILEERWLAEDKSTLHDLAGRFDVSAERIRQLEKNALAKLKKTMLA